MVLSDIDACIAEHGLKVSEKIYSKSKVVCINGASGGRTWKIVECSNSEINGYVHLGVTVCGGKKGGFKSMGDRMKEANSVQGMVKYAASKSGCRYTVGREGWKGIVVNKLMYGCGALAWYGVVWCGMGVVHWLGIN